MQTLQTTGREKNIQNRVRATAKCMMLLWLPSVQLKLVNGIDRYQKAERNKEERLDTNKDNKEDQVVGRR
jgi:hypothetical protein